MSASRDPGRAEPRPLWQFTRRGWVLLAAAVVLAAVALSGFDVQHAILRVLYAAGIDVMHCRSFWPVMSSLSGSNWFLHRPWPAMDFNLTFVMVALFAIGLHGRKNAVAWTIALITVALALDVGEGLLASFSGRHGPVWIPAPLRNRLIYLAFVLHDLGWIATLWILTRSWRRTAAFACLALCRFWVDVIEASRVLAGEAPFLLAIPLSGWVRVVFSWAWFGVGAGLLIEWGVRARFARVRPGHCPACGYDLRGGQAGGVCPECGAADDNPSGSR